MSSTLITTDLNTAFRHVRRGHFNPAAANVPADIIRKVRAQTAVGGGVNVDSMMGRMYSPFIQRMTLEEPRSWEERVRWKRYFAQTEPIVGAAAELHAEFPLSNLHIQHEDPDIREFFEDLIDEIDLYEFLVDLMLEWVLVGEAIPFGFFDDVTNPGIWTGFILLNPVQVVVEGSPWVTGRNKDQLLLKPDPQLQRLVQNPHDPVLGPLARQLPSDISEGVRTGQGILLNPVQCSRLKQAGTPFSKRSSSMVDRAFRALIYKDRLRSAQYAVADRHIAPTEIWKVGETGDPADPQEIENLQASVAATWSDVNKAIFTNHTVQYQCEGASGKLLPIWPEMEQCDKEIMTAMQVNEAILHGDGPSFGTSVVGYDILISRWLSRRMKLEKWIRRHVFGPVCKIHQMYVPEIKVKSSRYRSEAGLPRPLWIPDVKWERQYLKDETARITLIQELVGRGLLPDDHLFDLLEINRDAAEDMMEKQVIRKAQRAKKLKERLEKMGLAEYAQLALGQPAEGGPPGGGQLPSIDLGGDFGGGGGGSDFGGGGMLDLPEVIPGAEVGAPSAAFNPGELPGGAPLPAPDAGGQVPTAPSPL